MNAVGRIETYRQKVRRWQVERSLAIGEGAESYARVCEDNIDYFQGALRDEVALAMEYEA